MVVKVVAFSLEKDDIEKLQKIAKRLDRNHSDTIRHLIRQGIDYN